MNNEEISDEEFDVKLDEYVKNNPAITLSYDKLRGLAGVIDALARRGYAPEYIDGEVISVFSIRDSKRDIVRIVGFMPGKEDEKKCFFLLGNNAILEDCKDWINGFQADGAIPAYRHLDEAYSWEGAIQKSLKWIKKGHIEFGWDLITVPFEVIEQGYYGIVMFCPGDVEDYQAQVDTIVQDESFLELKDEHKRAKAAYEERKNYVGKKPPPWKHYAIKYGFVTDEGEPDTDTLDNRVQYLKRTARIT